MERRSRRWGMCSAVIYGCTKWRQRCLRKSEIPWLALSPQSALPPDAAQLKDQMDRSGLNYESKVQRMLMGELPSAVAALAKDLKGQLLELSHRLDMLTHAETDPRSREAATVLAQVKRAADALEFQQLSNQFALQEQRPSGAPPGAPVCIPHADNAASSYTAKATRRGNRPQSRSTIRSPCHSTSRLLGALHIEAAVHGCWQSPRHSGSRTPAVAEFLRTALPDLHARLQTLRVYTMRRLYCPGARDSGQ